MNKPYHGIILDLEFKDQDFLKRFRVLGKKKSSENPWFLFKVEVTAEELEKMIGEIQDQMVEGAYYCHFYRDNELIVIFKEKIFFFGKNFDFSIFISYYRIMFAQYMNSYEVEIF